jgi:TusA-related sulfurtransferase
MSAAPSESPNDTFATGLPVCYELLLYLSSRLARLSPGETLEFITDDPEADDQIPPWCEARNYTLLDSRSLPDGQRRFLIRKG